MARIKFKKRQLESFYDMLSFNLFKWQKEAIWQFYKDNKSEFHIVGPRQIGKSQILVVIALIELLLNGNKITFTSHMVKSCDDFFQKIKYELNHNKYFFNQVERIINPKGGQLISLKGAAKIEFIARSKDGGIGDSNDVIIFDEFQMLNEKQMSAIFPTLSARPNSITIYAGTSPRTIDDDMFYRSQRSKHFGTSTWCEFGLGHEYDFEYLKKHDLFLDKKLIKKANPSFEIMIPYENIVREYSKMDQLDYAIQRLGLFHTNQQKLVFSEKILNKVLINFEQAQHFKGDFVLAIKFGIDYHAAVIGTQKDGVSYLQVYDKRKNIDGFDWLANFILENPNIRGVMADGLYTEAFRQMIKSKFDNNYQTIRSHEFIAAENTLEHEVIMAKVKIANQTSIVSEMQNVSWKRIKEYSKYVPISDDSDVVVAEAMAIANYYIKKRGWR